MSAPDILLLDEPTNHLDLTGILELEELLKAAPFAYVVVSHDRYFLENVARRMLELDRVYADGLLQVEGTYSDLLVKRDEVRRPSASNVMENEIEDQKHGSAA